LGGVNIKAAILQKQVELQMDNLELFALKDFSWLDIKADKITQYKQGDQFKHPDYATAAQMGYIGTADDLEMAKQATAESEPATAQDNAAPAGAADAVDYNKMTVPALQAFLDGSGVKYPSDALKGDLVALAQKVK
jgi:hypothetical protein